MPHNPIYHYTSSSPPSVSQSFPRVADCPSITSENTPELQTPATTKR